MWQTPTFDPTLNMVYFGVANPTAPYQAGNRAGSEPIHGQYCSARRNER